jgi:tRNA-splicing ligase RtcB
LAKLKLKGKDLLAIGYEQGRAVGVAISIAMKHFKKQSKADVLAFLKAVKETPETYLEDEIWGSLAKILMRREEENPIQTLRSEALDFPIYGEEKIEAGAKEQMRTAMRLPVSVAGALMPDAHYGYGLPIGGVLATENEIIPYAVGVDIGCRMALSIFDLPSERLTTQNAQFQAILNENSRFGFDTFDDPRDDEVLHRSLFQEIPLLKKLKDKARKQIGSSGSGNHFVEFGVLELTEEDNALGVKPGRYVALLTHSGSRGLGANIAKHYTKLAMETCRLPQEAKHLAWLSLDQEAGQEYWLAMNLAGDYASACHRHIHERVHEALGSELLARVENHHNFAWKEQLADGRDVIVHRKGATPAGEGILGIIPGSMTAPAYVIQGKGEMRSLQSASHGAGRQLSRTKAKKQFNYRELKAHLKEKGVTLIGGGLDESPFAYKDIQAVMSHQVDLVDIVGIFKPKVVRMDK